jgi:hypothetical protein
LQLRKILEKLNINLSTKLAEYIIYVMKNYGTTEDSASIYDLKYLNLFKLIEESEKNTQNEPTKEEIEDDEESEESGIEISPEEYMQITDKVLYKIAIKSKFNPDSFFKAEVTKVEGIEAITLGNFVNIINKLMKIEIDDVEIYCMFNRFKLDEENEEDENLNYTNLKTEITSKKRLNFDLTNKIKNYLGDKKISFDEFIKPISSHIKEGYMDIDQFKNYIVKKSIMDWDDNLFASVNNDSSINENLLFREGNKININYLRNIISDDKRKAGVDVIQEEEVKTTRNNDAKRLYIF